MKKHKNFNNFLAFNEKDLDKLSKDKLTELTVDDLKGGFASRANI